MHDIATDGDGQPFQAADTAADRQRVQQGLCRMLVPAITGIDNRAINFFRQQIYRPGIRMADSQHIRMHGIQCHRRVQQGLALADGTGRHIHIDDIATKSLTGQFKRGPGTG